MVLEEKKVLIVDDIPENLQVLSNILYKENLEIGIAMDGEQALEAVQEDPPNLILLDVNMPRMDGYTVCQRLKADDKTKNIPIIFLTAKTETEDIVKGFRLGAVDYITKPFNGSELLSRVRTHLELNNSRKLIQRQVVELESLNKTKDKFFSIIAHDLKGPINGLVGLADILIEDFDELDNEQLKQIHGVIQETSKVGLKLLKNLLDWSRVQTGKVAFEPRNNNLHKLVNDTCELLSANAKLKDIKLANNVDDKLEASFDFNMINTVVRNLINNAIKFTNEDGVVEINACVKESILEVCVKDNGVGMSDEVKDKIFKIDEHVTKKGTNNEKGTGLGLVICMEYIKMHKGEIGVDSELNKGSNFYFRIPNNLT